MLCPSTASRFTTTVADISNSSRNLCSSSTIPVTNSHAQSQPIMGVFLCLDNHRAIPEILVQQNSGGDLWEREEQTTTDSHTFSAMKRGSLGFQDIGPSSRPSQLHVEQAIDTALNMLKSSSDSHVDGQLSAP